MTTVHATHRDRRDRVVAEHYSQAPQQYPEIAGDKNSSLDCRTFRRFLALYPPGECYYDIGCGTGRVGRHVCKQAEPARAVFFDISQKQLDIARELGSACADTRYVQGSVLSLKFQRVRFATCHGVIHHTPDPMGALESIVGALDRGGVLYLAVYSRSWYAVLYQLFSLLKLCRRFHLQFLVTLAYLVYYPLRYLLRVRETGKLSQDFNIRASFEDFVMTPIAHFYSQRYLRKLFGAQQLEVLDHELLNYRVLHCFVLRKR